MSEIFEFVQRHPFLVAALAAVITLIIFSEFQRITQKFDNLSPQQVVQAMNSGAPLLLDIRESRELSDGIISGAKHIPLSDLGKRITDLEKDKSRKIIAYCRSGNRSVAACRMLGKNEFTDVAHLQGGIIAWNSANLPLKSQ